MNSDFFRSLCVGVLGIATNILTLGVSLSDVREWLQVASLSGGLVVTLLTIAILVRKLGGRQVDDGDD